MDLTSAIRPCHNKMTFQEIYIKKPVKLFLNTFKTKKLALILGIDIIFYIIFFLGFQIFVSKAKKIVMSLQDLNLAAIQNLNNVDVEGANQLLAQLQTFIASIIGAVFLFILFIIAILTLIKGYEWSRIANNKLKPSNYLKLLLLNIIWFTIWVIIFIIPFSFIEKQAYLTHFYYIIPPILYFTLFLYMNFAQTKRIGKALLAPIKEGLLKLHKYVTALIIIILLFAAPPLILKFFNISLTLQTLNLPIQRISLIISAIIALLTLAVYKLYFYSVSIEK